MIYIDADCKCYANQGDGLRGFEVPFFDDKCATFVEGYRYVPDGESWIREDGVVFRGVMLSPWKQLSELVAAQAEYERNQEEMADMQEALALLGVTVDE